MGRPESQDAGEGARTPVKETTVSVTQSAAAGLSAAPVLAELGATSDAALRQLLHGLPGVDQAGRRGGAPPPSPPGSVKKDAKLWALGTAVRMVDLTTLEGADTPGKVRGLCAKARQPDPADRAYVRPVAAVCVYPDLVAVALEAGR